MNQKRILIVDDDKDFQSVLVDKLKNSGFDVLIANDGDEGVQKAEELMPDLILMDVKMPNLDGVQSMIKLKENKKTKDIKIVFLTAFGDPQPDIYNNDKRFAEELGAFDYLLKTQDLEEILEKVKELISKK